MSIKLPYISIEVNDRCNQSCCFCYNSRVSNEEFSQTNYIELRKLLVTLYRQAKIDRITFTGGEPMLEPRIAELVLFCKMRKSVVSIITNGTAVGKSAYKDLILLQTDLFEIPIHSYISDIHDEMTGVEGSWAKSLNSVSTIKSLGGTVVPVIVLTNHNLEELEKTIRFIASLGIKQIMLNRYNIGGNNQADAKLLMPSKEKLNEAYSRANQVTHELNLLVSSNVNTPHCILRPSDYPFIRFSGCANDILMNPLTIDIHGNLRKCNHSNVVAGNIYKEPLEKILKCAYFQSWETIIPEFCKDCNQWQQCRGGCRAASEQTGGDISMPDPIVNLCNTE